MEGLGLGSGFWDWGWGLGLRFGMVWACRSYANKYKDGWLELWVDVLIWICDYMKGDAAVESPLKMWTCTDS